MRLDELIPTHNHLRVPNKVLDIMDAVRRENFHNNEVCSIYHIGDEYYIGNGHHRLKAFWALGVYKDTNELPFPVQVKDFQLADLRSVNFTVGYVTPYNPRLECRKPDFFAFKHKVMTLFREWDEIDALDYIVKNYTDYKEPRNVWNLEQLS